MKVPFILNQQWIPGNINDILWHVLGLKICFLTMWYHGNPKSEQQEHQPSLVMSRPSQSSNVKSCPKPTMGSRDHPYENFTPMTHLWHTHLDPPGYGSLESPMVLEFLQLRTELANYRFAVDGQFIQGLTYQTSVSRTGIAPSPKGWSSGLSRNWVKPSGFPIKMYQ